MAKKSKQIDCLGMGIIPLDTLITIPKLPEPGGKADAVSLTVQGGGPVPNVMVALKRLGLSSAVVAVIGDDSIGQITKAELAQEGVLTDHLVIKKGKEKPSDSAYGLIEQGSGRRTIYLCRKLKLTTRDITTELYPIPKVIHLDGRDLAACTKLARWGKKVGAQISFDIGSMRNDVSSIFPLVDHLIVSDDYARGFTGKRNIKQAIKILQEYCSGQIVVTEGIKGSTGLVDGKFIHQPAFKVKTVDTTGAGDSYHAGYIFGLINEKPIAERMLLGAAVAALKVQKAGARDGNPKLTVLNRFLKNRPPIYA